MLEPKTPLPWRPLVNEDGAIVAKTGEHIGDLFDNRDRDYAVHAANALPEVLAALRGLVEIADPNDHEHMAARIRSARAALAKAEGAPEGGE